MKSVYKFCENYFHYLYLVDTWIGGSPVCPGSPGVQQGWVQQVQQVLQEQVQGAGWQEVLDPGDILLVQGQEQE